MNLEQAREHTRNASMATVLVLFVSLGVFYSAGDESLGGYIFLTAILLTSAASIYFYSRVVSILTITLLVPLLVILTASYSNVIGALLFSVYVFLLIQGSRAAFTYHRLKIDSDPQHKTLSRGMRIASGGGGGMAIGMILLAVMLVSSSKFASVPSFRVESGAQLGAKGREILERADIIDEDEYIHYFYSYAFLSILRSGSVLTNRRVISYYKEDGGLNYRSTLIEDIVDVEILRRNNYEVQTTLRISVKSGDGFVLVLPGPEDGSGKFIDALVKRIPEKTQEPGITLQGSDAAA